MPFIRCLVDVSPGVFQSKKFPPVPVSGKFKFFSGYLRKWMSAEERKTEKNDGGGEKLYRSLNFDFFPFYPLGFFFSYCEFGPLINSRGFLFVDVLLRRLFAPPASTFFTWHLRTSHHYIKVIYFLIFLKYSVFSTNKYLLRVNTRWVLAFEIFRLFEVCKVLSQIEWHLDVERRRVGECWMLGSYPGLMPALIRCWVALKDALFIFLPALSLLFQYMVADSYANI